MSIFTRGYCRKGFGWSISGRIRTFVCAAKTRPTVGNRQGSPVTTEMRPNSSWSSRGYDFFRPCQDSFRLLKQPTVDTVGYSRTSLRDFGKPRAPRLDLNPAVPKPQITDFRYNK
jgi:hypothetical protein